MQPYLPLLLGFLYLLAAIEVRGQLQWLQLQNGTEDNVTQSSPYPQSRRDALLSYDVTRNMLVLFGGIGGGGYPLNDTWFYTLNDDEWREVGGAGPSGRHGAVGGVSGDHFYLATGRDQHAHLNDVWRLDLGSEEWSLLSPPPTFAHSNESYVPAARYMASGGIDATGHRLYVSMGAEGDNLMEFTFSFDVNTNTWYKEDEGCGQYDPRCPHPRSQQASVMTHADQFVVFSGCLQGKGWAGPCPSHDVWRYDGQQKTWTQLDNCPAPRLHATLAMLPTADGEKRYALLYGGQSDLAKILQSAEVSADQVAVLDVEQGSWTIRKTSAENNESFVPPHRMSAAMATGSEGVYLFGGAALETGVLTNDLWLLKGNVTDVQLSPPVSCGKITVSLITVHGILMATAFGLLLPLGALLMRHCKTLLLHVIIQIVGLCCAIGGLAVGVVSVSSASQFSFVHAIVGIVAVGLGVLQPLNGLLRPKDPRPQERKGLARAAWQAVHRFGGRVCLLLGLVNGSLGVFLAVATLPIIIAWHAWLGFLLLLWLLGEIVRCCMQERSKGPGPSHVTSTLQQPPVRKRAEGGIINGWEKGEGGFYINPTTETARL